MRGAGHHYGEAPRLAARSLRSPHQTEGPCRARAANCPGLPPRLHQSRDTFRTGTASGRTRPFNRGRNGHAYRNWVRGIGFGSHGGKRHWIGGALGPRGQRSVTAPRCGGRSDGHGEPRPQHRSRRQPTSWAERAPTRRLSSPVPTPHNQEAAMAIGLGTLLLIIIVIALLT